MGEKTEFLPLTTLDKVTVILYRAGIVLSSLVVSVLGVTAYSLLPKDGTNPVLQNSVLFSILLFSLYFSVGLSVFFIHLYIGKLYRFLKRVYYLASFCLLALVIMGGGSPLTFLLKTPAGCLFLLPVVFCLGFVAAKEAFCFRLYEGYILFALMPAYLTLLAAGAMSQQGIVFGMVSIAVILVFFTARKIFMPLHYDIGDKSAYVP